jgi:hypothetical protein
MDTQEEKENYVTGKKAKLLALVFIGLMFLPICYAFYKEFTASRQAKAHRAAAADSTTAPHP